MKTKQWTEAEIRNLNPCLDGLAFAEARTFDLSRVWQECERGDWLIWLLRKTGKLDKATAAYAYAIAYYAYAIAYYAYAIAYYAYAIARQAERKWQADKIRESIANPFKQ